MAKNRGREVRGDGAALLGDHGALALAVVGARGIAAVNIGPELHHAVLRHERREIDEMHRHRFAERHVDALAVLGRRLHLLRRPAERAEQPRHDIEHLLHPDAAGGEGARRLAEELLQRRVVHIDAVLVRHVDAHHAERIEAAGVLHEAVVHHLRPVPIDAVRIDRPPFANTLKCSLTK